MLPGFAYLVGSGIAILAKLQAGHNNFDTNSDGGIDFKRIGKTPHVGSWDVQPFTGFTIDNFYDEYNGSDVYTNSRIIVTGVDAASLIPEYKFVTIGANRRPISWTINSATQVTHDTTSPFSFSNGGVQTILFER